MNTHSKMKCPISGEDITIISYPPYGSFWAGFVQGKSEIICPYKRKGKMSYPICIKESGLTYTERSSNPNKNVCIVEGG